ncbi:hypothetical protein [Winogradskyella sp. 3972H.M.0a.05]|uniref:hypothetical protein n=1 Tax=Winogradskyella sp. 3972H.M.0a.05 TaxID=2950277 RepID=UPI0033982045
MNPILDDFFEYLGIVLLFINACLYIWSYRTIRGSVALKYFSTYLATIFIVLLSSLLIVKVFKVRNNLYLSHLYFLSQFVLLSLFYKSQFKKNQKKWVNITLSLVLLIVTIQYINKPQLLKKFNLFEIFISSFPLVVYSIVHLYNALNNKGKYMLINAGVLMYIATSTLIFILGDYITSNTKNHLIAKIWFINKVLYVGYLLLILVEWKKNISPLSSKS